MPLSVMISCVLVDDYHDFFHDMNPPVFMMITGATRIKILKSYDYSLRNQNHAKIQLKKMVFSARAIFF